MLARVCWASVQLVLSDIKELWSTEVCMMCDGGLMRVSRAAAALLDGFPLNGSTMVIPFSACFILIYQVMQGPSLSSPDVQNPIRF